MIQLTTLFAARRLGFLNKEDFDNIKKYWEKAAPEDKWGGSSNHPFYVILDKPRPSLSKHEGTPRGENMWHMDDGIFIVGAKKNMGQLIEFLNTASSLAKTEPEKALTMLKELTDDGK